MACPGNPPPPDGYKLWIGLVPPSLSTWAYDLLEHVQKPYPFFHTWQLAYGGEYVIARKEHHPWTTRNGVRVWGCFTGITLYRPTAPGERSIPPDPNSNDVARYTLDNPIDWPLVALSGLAGAGVVILFITAMKHAGKVKPRRLQR